MTPTDQYNHTGAKRERTAMRDKTTMENSVETYLPVDTKEVQINATAKS